MERDVREKLDLDVELLATKGESEAFVTLGILVFFRTYTYIYTRVFKLNNKVALRC